MCGRGLVSLDRLDVEQDSGERELPLACRSPQPPFPSSPQSLAGAGWIETVVRSRCQLMPGFPQGVGPQLLEFQALLQLGCIKLFPRLYREL